MRSLRSRIQGKRAGVSESDCSPRVISHATLAQSLEKQLIDTRWVSKRSDPYADHDPDEILGRFKWFFAERLKQLVPSQEMLHMKTLNTAR